MNINSRTSKINFTGFKSGAVASFTGLRVAPIKVRSYINAIQEGSGDPTPDNIRPIIGRNSVTITANAVDHMISLGDTVYGGSLDVTNGVLTMTRFYLKGGFTQYASGNGYKAYRKDNLPRSKAQSTGGISNMIGEFGSFSSSAMNKNIISLPISATLYMALDENYNASDVEVAYELATPITVQLTPTQVEQIIGTNNIFSDSGNVEVYYVTI